MSNYDTSYNYNMNYTLLDVFKKIDISNSSQNSYSLFKHLIIC